MKQEDKDLLLKYLCMALTYGVMVNVEGYDTEKLIGIENETITTKATPTSYSDKGEYPIDIVKPYLRPMSSMTEEESNELESITFPLMEKDWDGNENPACIRWIDIPKYMDFILSHHFDYQGLIEKGLALEVTKENNPYKD